jgi:hypothetical protein
MINLRKMLRYWLLPFLMFAETTVGQTRTGTVITIFHSPEEVVLASDGRGSFGAVAQPTNNDCKLVPLDKNLISGFGGVTGFIRVSRRSNKPYLWEFAHEAAIAELRTVSKTAADRPAAIAAAWAQRMKVVMDQALSGTSESPGLRQRLSQRSMLVSAIFAGSDLAGKLVVYKQDVNCACARPPLKSQVMPIRPIDSTTLEVPAGVASTDAGANVYDELLREGPVGVPQRYYRETADRAAAITLYFTEEIIKRAHDPLIGGAVDVLKIRKGSSYETVQLRMISPQNKTPPLRLPLR